jgi:hypothetical protein
MYFYIRLVTGSNYLYLRRQEGNELATKLHLIRNVPENVRVRQQRGHAGPAPLVLKATTTPATTTLVPDRQILRKHVFCKS